MMKPPSDIIGLDWETYYDDLYTLKKLTTTAYIRDPRFLPYGASVRWNNQKRSKWMLWADLLPYLRSINWRRPALLAHHTHFDGLILTHHVKRKPAYYYDTLSMGRALFGMETGASLGALAEFLGFGSKHATYLDDVKGVRKPTKKALHTLGMGAKQDTDLMWDIFREMLPEFPSDELDLIHYTVKAYCEPTIKLDKKRAMRAHNKVVRDRRALLRNVAYRSEYDTTEVTPSTFRFTEKDYEHLRKRLRSRVTFPDMLRGLGVEPPLKISKSWLEKPLESRDPEKKFTFAFASTDLAFVALKQHPDIHVRDLVEAKLLCSSSIHETKPLRMIEHADPALTVYLNYWGARNTGRWSGGDKTNMQAMGRDGILRGAMKAAPGHKFVIGDSRAIEPVMNSWLAGDHDLLEQFADKDLQKRGMDPYTIFASNIFKRTITKADSKERFVGKVPIIALGYQMGAARLQHTFETGSLGPAIVLEQHMYQEIVDMYRMQRRPIVDQWWYLNDTLKKMMHKGFEETYRDCLHFSYQDTELPNEMHLRYPNLRYKVSEDEEGNQSTDIVYRQNTKLYGGKVNENDIQALSRVVVGQQYLLIAHLYRMVLLAHDEIVLHVPDKKVRQAKHDLLEALRTPLPWCPDAPLDGEVGVFNEYVKM